MNKLNGKNVDKKKVISKDSKSMKETNNKEKNNNHQKPLISNWYIMFEEIVTAKMIAEQLEELGYTEIDVWNEINILGLEIAPKVTMDFEPMEPFRDPSDVAFVNENKIQTIYALTLSNGLEAEEKKAIRGILVKWNGLLCGDSDDFTPIYRVKNL